MPGQYDSPMPPYKEQGVVLRSIKLGEADKIVTMMTQGSGKVRAVAKGIRKTTSRFGARLGAVHPRVADAVSRPWPLDTITQAEIIAPHMAIREDLGLFAAGETMLEAVDKVAEEHERNVRLALLLLAGVRALDTKPADPGAVAESFMLKLLSLSGFHPSLTACAVCGATDPQLFSAGMGGAVCPTARRRRGAGLTRGARASAAAGRRGPERCRRRGRDRRPDPRGGARAALRVRGVPPGAADAVAPHAREVRAVSSFLPDIDPDKVPAHVAIVMDGNGRWATQRGLPRTDGHAAGEEALADTVEGGVEVGCKWLTVYAFSTENWRGRRARSCTS